MPRFTKKPVTIEAVQFTGDNAEEVRNWMYPHVQQVGNPSVWFHLAEGHPVIAVPGKVAVVWDLLHSTWVGVDPWDWIIKGVQGEFYPCDPDVFEKTYAPEEPLSVRRFVLQRDADITGISGTGVVAEGTLFSDGHAAIRWVTGEHRSTVVWGENALQSIEAIHGHGGATRIVWKD